MTGLADEQAQANHAQVAALALGMTSTSQLASGRRRDVRVEVGRVERQHVGGQLEPPDRSLRKLDLCHLELALGHRLRDAMERLACER